MSSSVSADPNVHEVVTGLVQARDAQIARVVAMVDNMPDRGAADALIAPLRARLAQLRPARPFGFTRLLFSPLDPVIVTGGRWRRGDLGVPRPALAPLGQAVQAALPALSQTLEPGACRVTPDDRPAIAALGAGLWPAAAAVVEAMPPPPNWVEASGLALADFPGLAAVIAAVLRQASRIEAMAASRDKPSDEAIRQVLHGTEAKGGIAVGTTVCVMLARLAVPARVLAVAFEIGSDQRPTPADRVLEHTLSGLKGSAAADKGDATDAAIEAGRVASLLAGLEEDGHLNPERRRQLDHIRKEADARCRQRFDHAVAATLAQADLAAGPEQDEAVAGLESAARDLRRLESAGRRLGGADHYDSLVQSVCAQFSDAANPLGLADRVRMVEILAGPDEALALLAKG